MDRDALVVVLEDGDEFESRTKSFEVLAQRRTSSECSSFEIAPWVTSSLPASVAWLTASRWRSS